MASNENQGLQIVVIILLITVLPLAAITWFIFTQNTSRGEKIKDDEAKIAKAEANLAKAIEDVNKYKQMIGLAEEVEADAAAATFEQDMGAYAATIPAEKRFYRQAIEEMAATVVKANQEKTATQAKISEIETENAKARAEAKVQVEEANKVKDAAVAELEAEKRKFMEAQTKAEGEKKDVLDQLAASQSNFSGEIDKLNKSVEQLSKEKKTAEDTVTKLTKVINSMRGGSFDVDDGEIRTVQERTGTVWVNLGSGDGLRPQTTFYVHAPNVSPGDVAARKGTVEVTQIMGEHLAEARIVDDLPNSPILPGDKIYTSLWDPGRREHFALAGRIDLDGDGNDDRDRLRNIITLSGGVIDAEIDDSGKQTGSISVDTRYLIEGQISPRAQGPVDKLRAEAALLGVERIGADKVLDHIAYKASQQTVRYGSTGNVDSTTRALPDGGLPKGVEYYGDMFRKRAPPPQPAVAPKF
jgi:hypothetical protein